MMPPLLTARRRAVMASGLPRDYQRVAWVGPNTVDKIVYIDTGFVPNQDTRVVTAATRTINSTYATMYGTESPRFSYLKARVDYNTMQKFTVPAVGLDTLTVVDHDKNYITINGTTYGPIADYAEFTCSGPLYLWTLNGYTQTTVQYCGQMYYCKIYDNGTLARDLVPCYRREDGAIGFYDRVEREFLSPPSNGEYMAKGEDVL